MNRHWDPFGDLAEIRERINRIFEDTLRGHAAPADMAEAGAWSPRVDIWETATSLVFEVELPGVSREDTQVEIEGDRLTLKGERKPAEGREFVRVERPFGPFHRSFSIGVPIDQAAVAAKYRDGVLEITVPKANRAQSNQVKVPVG